VTKNVTLKILPDTDVRILEEARVGRVSRARQVTESKGKQELARDVLYRLSYPVAAPIATHE
jgi:hypothetical protein